MSQYDPIFDLKIHVGHCDLYFMVHWFCLISWRLFDVWTSYFGIMSQYDPTCYPKIKIGDCDLYFVIQWFCAISWRLFDVWPSYFGIMSQNYLKINVGHCDLYVLFQRFLCNTIWCINILWDYESVWSDDWTQHKYKSLWPMSSEFVLYLEDYLMYIYHTLGLGFSMSRHLI